MAKRGPKKKLPSLHVVTGNPGNRQQAEAPEIECREVPLEPPKKLSGVRQKLWDRYIQTAWWLTDHDVPSAFMWVCLYAEYLRSPNQMPANRIGQYRALTSELGMDPASRARMGVKKPGNSKRGLGKYVD